MSHRSASLLIEDIWESVEKIERYVVGMDRESFVRDDKTVDSVTRNLEIIGEAANRLPEDFTKAHPEIEWRKVVGLRHRIVHDYFSVDPDLLWQILRNDLSIFKQHLSVIRREKLP